MSYSFDIIGVSPILTFFNYQQQQEQDLQSGQTYLGSYDCSLDAFINSLKILPKKPNWDWDEVVSIMVNFWLTNESKVRYWKQELSSVKEDSIIVAKVINFNVLKTELETLFKI